MADQKPLTADNLFFACDPGRLGFRTTEDLKPLEELIGQDRAMDAIRLSAEIKHRDFNLFGLGPTGIGRRKAVVHDRPGVTRDRNIDRAEHGGVEFLCVDTGGFDTKLDDLSGMEARFALHQRCADEMRAHWSSLGLELLCKPELAANTLSAIRYPAGVDASLVGRIKEQGVVVAGGLHPACKAQYFRVGHMGEVTRRPEALDKTRQAVATALNP